MGDLESDSSPPFLEKLREKKIPHRQGIHEELMEVQEFIMYVLREFLTVHI